eukprot:m.243420 g.243420  ORF g.243420 m.243420 type:complete len:239 (+) comp27697_c0_seq1:249-965(+)
MLSRQRSFSSSGDEEGEREHCVVVNAPTAAVRIRNSIDLAVERSNSRRSSVCSDATPGLLSPFSSPLLRRRAPTLLELSSSTESLNTLLQKPMQTRPGALARTRHSLTPLDNCVVYSDVGLSRSASLQNLSLADERISAYTPLLNPHPPRCPDAVPRAMTQRPVLAPIRGSSPLGSPIAGVGEGPPLVSVGNGEPQEQDPGDVEGSLPADALEDPAAGVGAAVDGEAGATERRCSVSA